MTTILHKRGNGIPTADKFEAVGEILIDSETGIAYTLNDANEVVSVGGDDLWGFSEPNEFGQKFVKFSDQIDNPDDARNFYIRYSSDPENSTKSNSLINTEKLWANKIEASKVKAADSLETTEVIAAAVESVASVAVEQVVIGGIVVGDADLNTSYTEEQKAEARAMQSAFQVIKPSPFGNEVTVDIDKDGSITATGVVQAADFLDADGNSIIGAGGDPDWALVADEYELGKGSESIHLGYKEPSFFPASEGTSVGYRAKSGQMGIAIGWKSVCTDSATALGAEANAGLSGIALGQSANAGDQEFAISPSVSKVNFSKATVQAKDFLDADGNSIVGAGGGDPEWSQVDATKVAIGFNTSGYSEAVAIGYRTSATNESVSIGFRSGAEEERCVSVGYEAMSAYECGTAIGYRAESNEYGIALGYEAECNPHEFAISRYIQDVNFPNARVKAASYLDAEGRVATVSPSTMVGAFTTLQTAIADETTIEGIKTALTNSLGGLIEKFEGLKNG